MKRCFGSPDREWLHPENFGNEPVYCEAPQTKDDILCHGSDDETYGTPTERRIRCEDQARRFLEGKPVFLLSASLRGPFDKASSWVNPWRSKSAPQTKPTARRKRPSAPKKATQQLESSGIVDDSVPAVAPPPVAHDALPRYMDGQAFHRVCDWRNQVVAETDVPTSPSQQASQTQPASADSRRATQHTTRRRSGMTVDTLDNGLRSSPLFTPRMVDEAAEQGTSGALRGHDEVEPSFSARDQPVLGSSQGTASQNLHLPIVETVTPAIHNSPQALESSGRPILSVRTTQPPSSNQIVEESIPAAKVSAAHAPVDKENSEPRNATPYSIPLQAASSPALPKTHASARTDGSFRYRRQPGREKGSLMGSKLAGHPSAPSDAGQRPSPDAAIPQENVLEDAEGPEPPSPRRASDAAAAIASETAEEADEVAPEVTQETPESMPQPELLQGPPDDQAADDDQSEEGDSTETTSQIDGPTLVPSESPSGSERPSMPSFGHFSAEKHSQDLIADSLGVPRRLLWPKSRRSASGDPPPVFGLESSRIFVSEPVIEGRFASPVHPVSPEGHGSQSAKKDLVQAPPEARASIGDQLLIVVKAEDEAESAAESAAESKTASEAENDGMQKTEHEQVEAQAESVLVERDAEAGTQPAAPPAAGTQSPWAEAEAALSLKSPNHQPPLRKVKVEMDNTQSTPPRANQSPWAKESNTVPAISAQPPIPPLQAVARSTASQALGQLASQSPWVRGDSQMQLPDTRLFNPLSSPANSYVLPTANPAPPPDVPRGEEIDMSNLQAYPPHPSTPETKHSSLPTPDFTFSAKSFKNFMTPSPQPAAKRRRISNTTPTTTSAHLPSTQALLNAAISNPWTKPPSSSTTKAKPNRQPKQHRPKKRVSWAADLQADNTTSPNPPTQPNTTTPRLHLRATSPPPTELSFSSTPTTPTEKFAKHFAAVAGRRQAGVMRGMRLPQKQHQGRVAKRGGGFGGVRLLPSGSQQVCGSPAVEAMAEAFLRGDAEQERYQGEGAEDERVGQDKEGDMVEEGDRETREEEEEEMEMDGEERLETLEEAVLGEELPVDEVSAVMENLDDFLGGAWDLDAELARARAGQEREGGVMGAAGLMDVGVWD